MPARLTNPTVGLIPTTPLAADGQMIEPLVSVPIATVTNPAATAAAEPELDPQALRSRTYGLRVSPPRPLQPLVERVERKFAHSLKLALPRITAPASRSFAATVASRGAGAPSNASDPAVVGILSPVSMLAFSRTGIPHSGPRWPTLACPSRSAAICRASGFNRRTAFTRGPAWSSESMRWMKACTSCCESSLPLAICCCRSPMLPYTVADVSLDGGEAPVSPAQPGIHNAIPSMRSTTRNGLRMAIPSQTLPRTLRHRGLRLKLGLETCVP